MRNSLRAELSQRMEGGQAADALAAIAKKRVLPRRPDDTAQPRQGGGEIRLFFVNKKASGLAARLTRLRDLGAFSRSARWS